MVLIDYLCEVQLIDVVSSTHQSHVSNRLNQVKSDSGGVLIEMDWAQPAQDGGLANVKSELNSVGDNINRENMKAEPLNQPNQMSAAQMSNNMPSMGGYNNMNDSQKMDNGPQNPNYGPYQGYPGHMNNFKGMMPNQMPNMYPGSMSNYSQPPQRMPPSPASTPTLNQLLQNSPNSPQPSTRFTDSAPSPNVKNEIVNDTGPINTSNGPSPYMGGPPPQQHGGPPPSQHGGWPGPPGGYNMQHINQAYMRPQVSQGHVSKKFLISTLK